MDDLMVGQLVALSVGLMVGRRETMMAVWSAAVMADMSAVQKDVRTAATTVVSTDMRSVCKQVVW